MLQLQDIDNKEDLMREFFIWLFDDPNITDKEVTLTKEIDYTMCSTYNDPYIYYPKQIQAFFNTKPMQRLARISQLDFIINKFPNAYHSRLEHSKGVYNKKVEELFYNFRKPEWKSYIEKNNLKLYLIADLIKSAGHDIGHLPFSHGLEIQLFNKRDAHEIIGKRIMTENGEVQNILDKITPRLKIILKELYEKDILNFREHDESSYDNDRLDYLNRDNLYLGLFSPLQFQQYDSVSIETNEFGIPLTSGDGSIKVNQNGKKVIDVYEYESLAEIERLLEHRKKNYLGIYASPHTQISEGCIKNFLNCFLKTNSKYDLKEYLWILSKSSPEDLNLELFLDWDEVRVYSDLLNIAKNDEDKNIRDLATMLIPTMPSFLNLMYSYLGVRDKGQSYTSSDKKILMQIKELIRGSSSLSLNLQNNDFVIHNSLFFSENPFSDVPEFSNFIEHFTSIFKSYKCTEPIYIKDKIGRIFELSRHPDRKKDWDKDITKVELYYTHIPYLRFNNISDKDISTLEQSSEDFGKLFAKPYVTSNMKPVQAGHKIEDIFLEI